VTSLERELYDRWLSAPHRRFGRCATCGCTETEEGKPLYLAGVNGASMVCFLCFGDEHDGAFPNYRRRRVREAA